MNNVFIPKKASVRSSNFGLDGVYDGTVDLDTGEVNLSQGDSGYVAFEGDENKKPGMNNIRSFFLLEEELDAARILYVLDSEDFLRIGRIPEKLPIRI